MLGMRVTAEVVIQQAALSAVCFDIFFMNNNKLSFFLLQYKLNTFLVSVIIKFNP